MIHNYYKYFFFQILSLTLLGIASLHGQGAPQLTSQTLDSGGGLTSSSSYSNVGSLGGIAGVSSIESPAHTLKSGYVGQLYEVTGIQVTASVTVIDEGHTSQLSAKAFLDDATTFVVPGSEVLWSVTSGPIDTVRNDGLLIAGLVYQNTNAKVKGTYLVKSGEVQLTVNNVGEDDFGLYAMDGLPDVWQIQHFDEENSEAAPTSDPDGDGQDNAFEYTAGLIPTDALSRFFLSVERISNQNQLSFSPIVDGRTYTVMTSPNLSLDSWSPLINGTIIENGQQRTVTDPNINQDIQFYTVEIENP